MKNATLRAGFLGACPFPVPQGSQVFLRDHARAFQEAGHHAHLITYGYGIGEDTSDLSLHRSLRLPFARKTSAGPSFLKPLLDAALILTVRRVVRAERLHAIFAHNYEALLVALAANGCPVIYHAHNTMEDELPYYFPGARWSARAGAWLDQSFPRRADAILVPHARLAEHLASLGCNPARVQVLAPPVWCGEFAVSSVGDALPTVDYAGNLDAYQNLPLLTEAMAQLRARLPEARLRLLAHAAMDALPGAETVLVKDFAALRVELARDTVFAVPRVGWSGYPVKILNAMAAGKAIVVCESAAHAVRQGETALVVPDNDASAFAAALETLLRQSALRAQLGANARAWVQRECAPRQVGERLADLVRQVAGNPG